MSREWGKGVQEGCPFLSVLMGRAAPAAFLLLQLASFPAWAFLPLLTLVSPRVPFPRGWDSLSPASSSRGLLALLWPALPSPSLSTPSPASTRNGPESSISSISKPGLF